MVAGQPHSFPHDRSPPSTPLPLTHMVEHDRMAKRSWVALQRQSSLPPPHDHAPLSSPLLPHAAAHGGTAEQRWVASRRWATHVLRILLDLVRTQRIQHGCSVSRVPLSCSCRGSGSPYPTVLAMLVGLDPRQIRRVQSAPCSGSSEDVILHPPLFQIQQREIHGKRAHPTPPSTPDLNGGRSTGAYAPSKRK